MTIKSAAVLGTEDAQAFFVRSGDGIFTFHLGRTAMSVLRQTADGHALVLTANVLGDQARCRLILDGWPMGARYNLVEEIIGAIDAALGSDRSQFTQTQRTAFDYSVHHLRAILAAEDLRNS